MQTNLRKNIRERRSNLTKSEQAIAANKNLSNLLKLSLFTRYQKFACYLANAGELNTQPLIKKIWQKNKQCYLPLLHWNKQNKLQFMPFTTETPLIKNRYNILEPKYAPHLIQAPWAIDVIFVPLVAFDNQGHRIGMGGGYYDRTLSFLLRRNTWMKPKLVGLAYDFQKVDVIKPQPWDVPLSCIITETAIYKV